MRDKLRPSLRTTKMIARSLAFRMLEVLDHVMCTVHQERLQFLDEIFRDNAVRQQWRAPPDDRDSRLWFTAPTCSSLIRNNPHSLMESKLGDHANPCLEGGSALGDTRRCVCVCVACSRLTRQGYLRSADAPRAEAACLEADHAMCQLQA